MLIILAGLPATGKTSIARELARALGAVYLRIDSIEQAMLGALSGARTLDDAGYRVGYAVAGDNLRLGRTVVADSVNPLALTRDAWREVAELAGASCVEVEVTCTDPAEHRRGGAVCQVGPGGPAGDRSRLKCRLTGLRLSEYRKAKEITTPDALRNQSLVMTPLTRSPAPSIANNNTANHQAHLLRRSRPAAAAHVAAPRSRSGIPANLPKARNTAAPGSLISHSRSVRGLGTNSEHPTNTAIPLAANRNAATMGTVVGLCSVTRRPPAVYRNADRRRADVLDD